MIKNQIDQIFSLTESKSIWKEGEIIVTSDELKTTEGKLKLLADEYPIWLSKFENKFGKFDENNKTHINIRTKWATTNKINLDFFECDTFNIIWKDGQKKISTRYNIRIIKQLNKFPFPFDTVGGNFWCYDNQLTSLKGAPQSIGRDFYCFNNQLTSLEGAPQEVGGDFRCYHNQIETLEGAPHSVGGDFRCYYNRLETLEGAPQDVGGDFGCFHNQLKTLEGAPQIVKGIFDCSTNPELSKEEIKKIKKKYKKVIHD